MIGSWTRHHRSSDRLVHRFRRAIALFTATVFLTASFVDTAAMAAGGYPAAIPVTTPAAVPVHLKTVEPAVWGAPTMTLAAAETPVSADAIAAAAVTVAVPGVYRQTPQSLAVTSAPTLPPAQQLLEAATVHRLSDRDTNTEHVVFGPSLTDIQMDTGRAVAAIKVFGPAALTLSVQADAAGIWVPVNGLQNLNLSTLAPGWSILNATTPVPTGKLRVELTPLPGFPAAGLRELEVWASGNHKTIADGAALLSELQANPAFEQGRLYAAAPALGVIGDVTASPPDDPTDNTFVLAIPELPAAFRRAFLTYEINGAAHWMGASRSINGGAVQGGLIYDASSVWTRQIEPIDPEWLVPGANSVTFSVPPGSGRSYSIRNLNVIAELDNGANFVSKVDTNQPAVDNQIAWAYDGDLTTSWTPYSKKQSVRATGPTVEVYFDRSTQIHGVSLNVSGTLGGTVLPAVLSNGVWTDFPTQTLDGALLAEGWNHYTYTGVPPIDGLRLTFSGGKGANAVFNEILAYGSGFGARHTPPVVAVGYPDAGQFHDRTAVLRGFVGPADNGSGAAALTAAGVAMPHANGAFEFTLTKEQAGVESQGNNEAWSVPITVTYPDGQTVTTVVDLTENQGVLELPGTIEAAGSQLVTANTATTVTYDEAVLDIDATALSVDTTITVEPLAQVKLPALGPGMTNVTRGPRKGYRFAPNNIKFNNKIGVTLPYNKAKVPPGQVEADIRTFYFDEEDGQWKALELVTVDTVAHTVTSRTDHFTDLINATVTVPDHPQAVSFNPTQIKDIKAADPGAGINLIEAPQANNMGDARLSYPIEIPPGRNGLQPQLGLQYNSSGGNGWAGLGWDMPMQAIEIDTRWGVPRYDTGQINGTTPLETETYLLNGEQLTPVAHRGDLQPRTGEKVFHTRVEGQFRKIIRHGDNPTNYWWEVIDKSGTRSFYGGGPDLNAGAGGVSPNAVLANPDTLNPNIYKWTLRAIVDLNGNAVQYQCEVVDSTTNGGLEPTRQIYLTSIRYTGRFGTEDGPYEVVFNRTAGRPDVIVDGRPGFKTATADRLTSIDVRLWRPAAVTPELIRRYQFDYTTGQFNKSLLTRVAQLGEDGITEFNAHEFDYFDEVATATPGQLNGFRALPEFTGQRKANGGGFLFDVNSSPFSGVAGKSDQVHLYLGLSNTPGKGNSIGGKVGFESSDSDTIQSLMDLNGDGLPDQVYRAGSNGIVYRRNLGGADIESITSPTPLFAGEKPVLSREDVGKDNANTLTFGPEVYIGAGTGLFNTSLTWTRGDVYINDVNGDGLPDLIVGSAVSFNSLDANGDPSFGPLSPTPIGAGAPTDPSDLVPDARNSEAELRENFHLVDPIRRWVAPYSGTIDITGGVTLAAAPPSEYLTADGVRVAIQLENSEIYSLTITDTTPQTITGLTGIAVTAGQRLYFRVNSINDGKSDEVLIDPTITYATVGGVAVDPTATDERGLPLYIYTASADYAYGGRALPLGAPVTGTATLAGNLEKSSVTSDDIVLRITQNGTVIHSQTLTGSQIGPVPVSVPLTTAPGDEILTQVVADTRVDLSGIRFAPLITYNTINGAPAPTGQNSSPLFVFAPAVTAQIFPTNVSNTPYQPWAAPGGTITVTQTISESTVTPAPLGYDGDVTLAVKRAGLLLAKRKVEIRNGAIVGGDIDGNLTVTMSFDTLLNDPIYFTADATAPDTLNHFAIGAPQYTPVLDPVSLPHDIHLGIAVNEAFGGGYRRWWFGQYNGNDAALPIDQTRLRLPATQDDPVIKQFLGMIPFLDEDPLITTEPEQGRWRLEDKDAFIGADRMAATRLGVKFLDFPDGTGFGGARGVARLSRSVNVAVGGSYSFESFSTGGGASLGTNWSDIDFLDFNGDRYPDVVGGGKVQPSLPNGGLWNQKFSVGGFSRVRQSQSANANANLGATLSRPVADSEGTTDGQTTEQGPYNLSAGTTGSTSTVNTDWDLVDINGDGLPDYVRPGASSLKVRLNLGNRFGAEEDWGGNGTLRNENTISLGFNGGAGFTDVKYGFGGGLSSTLSRAGTEQDLMDVNGDGLVDIVSKSLDLDVGSSSTVLSVRFNTGNGFAPAVSYLGAQSQPIRKRTTVSRNLGLHFTYSQVLVPLPPLFLIINPGYNGGQNLGRALAQLQDFDGDGYIDHIFSTTNLIGDPTGNIRVHLNNHGKTNLLKAVRRPLGAEIALDYERSGNTPDHPGNRWVLASTTVFDGFTGDGADYRISSYDYENGFHDRAERAFYGFRTVTNNNLDTSLVTTANIGTTNIAALPVYRSAIQTFQNDSFYTKGLLESQVTQDGLGAKFLETINTYDVATVADGAGLVGLEAFTETRFPRLRRTDKNFYEGQAVAGKTTYETFNYDALGNVIAFFDAGDVGTADDVTGVIGYSGDDPAALDYATCQANHIVGIADSITVTDAALVPVELRRRESTVNCATGNVDQVRQYLADGTAAVTDLAYDAEGKLTGVTGPANVNLERFALTFGYDTVVRTHIQSITDSFGYQSTVTHDFKYGTVASTTDLNGNQMAYSFDAFGRTETITGPYQTGAGLATIAFEYHPEAVVPWALTKHIDVYRDTADPIETVLFTDGVKRVLQTKKDSAVHINVATGTSDVMTVSGRVTFDFVGRAIEQFYPITEPLGQAGLFNPASDIAAPPTRTVYDVLDRTTQVTIPDNTSTTTAYDFGPDRNSQQQFRVTVTDANLVKKESYRNVRDLFTTVKEFNDGGLEILETSYAYDPLSQIVEVKDHLNNLTTAGYDNFGRRTFIDNPDTGRTAFTYDLANNMTAKETANLRAAAKQITYGYQFNRLLSITYPDSPLNNVTYDYGDVGEIDVATFNRLGRIEKATSEAGVEERFYGPLGETVKQVWTINSDTLPQGDPQEVYTTEYVFDTFNRLQRMTYPDGEILTYAYDSGGLLREAMGVKGAFEYAYVTRLEYDEFEQRAFAEFGNNVRTTYDYDPLDRRLQTLTSRKAGGTLFQNLGYSYDDVGNVLGMTNTVAVPPANQFGGPVTFTYGYDDLYRLTSATGSFEYQPGKVDRFDLTMTYDGIHNIRTKSQIHEVVQPGTTNPAIPQRKTSYAWIYDYTGPQPHAPSHIGQRSFLYDANGNQTGWDHDQNGTNRRIVWDEENRVQTITDTGHTTSYKYDAAGERVIKRGPQGETVYVNQFFTIRNREIGTKHIFTGPSRAVSKLMAQDKPGANPSGKQPREKDLYFYHPDHLGSSSYVTDTEGKLYQHLQYFPFGETWVEQATNTQRTPYRFTGKELDEETGLYYFGARYYDPRTSVWQSADPILGQYLDGQPNGGVFAPASLNLYGYVKNRPLMFIDPDGRQERRPNIVVTTRNQDGSEETDTRFYFRTIVPYSDGGNYVGDSYEVGLERGGSITRMEQTQSAPGEPAMVTDNMRDRLLDLSENEERRTVYVPSGTRTPAQNEAVGGAEDSSHLVNEAADIHIPGYTAEETADAAHESGLFNRSNEYSDGRVHVDMREGGNQGRFTDWVPQPDPVPEPAAPPAD